MSIQEKAYKLGYNAESIVPCKSIKLMNLMDSENVQVGEGVPIMKAFKRGFLQEGIDRLVKKS